MVLLGSTVGGGSRLGSGVGGDVVVGQRRGQVTVGVGLGEQLVGLLLEGGDGVGAGRPAQRRLVGVGKPDQRAGELGGVAALLAAHGLPGGDGLPGALGVVVDRGLGVAGGVLGEQL